MKGLFKKGLGVLLPADAEAQSWLDGIKSGEVVRGEFRKPRNVHHHRKFFALLNLIHKNQSHYDSVDDILLAFKFYIGHGHWVILRRRDSNETQEIFQPESISFAKMDQAAFDIFYKKAIDFVCSHVIPGLDRSDLERELLEFAA